MLHSLTMCNFKGFASQTVRLAPLTLLTGLNGSGKSTVLQALALLRQSGDAGFLAEGKWLLNGSMVDLGTAGDVRYDGFPEPVITLAVGATGMAGKVSEISWPVGAGEEAADVLFPVASGALPTPACWNALSLFGSGFQYLRADRVTPSVVYPKSQHAVRSAGWLGSRGEYSVHFLREYGDELRIQEALRHPDELGIQSLLGQVNAWMQEFSPGVRLEPCAVPATDLVQLQFQYRGAGKSYGRSLRATNVGFGLSHVLPVIVAALAARPDSLVLIENPETQLHPRGQAAIGRLLALATAGGVQMVVETHSDHVLNGVRLAVKQRLLGPDQVATHFFSRQPGREIDVASPRLDPRGRLSFWPPDFFDQWEKSLDALTDD